MNTISVYVYTQKPGGEAEGFINSKLPMTEKEGYKQMQYTEVCHGSYNTSILKKLLI